MKNIKWVQFGNWFLETLKTVYYRRTCCAHPCSLAVRDTVFLLQNFSRKKDHSFLAGQGGWGEEGGI